MIFNYSKIPYKPFMPIRERFIKSAKILITKNKLVLTPEKIADTVLEEHLFAEKFYDVDFVINKLLSLNYKVIICTDSNEMMINDIRKEFEKLGIKFYISENLKCYKNEEFFERVLKDLKIESKNLIHIGDSLKEIEAADNIGIKTYFLDRENKRDTKFRKVKNLKEVLLKEI